jgi:hypothetical protein
MIQSSPMEKKKKLKIKHFRQPTSIEAALNVVDFNFALNHGNLRTRGATRSASNKNRDK